MTNIRIITPIISERFRDDSSLQSALPAGCNVSGMFLDKGPASVESAVDEVLAAPGVIDAARRSEAEGAEAVVIDCMLDPGLDAAREAVRIPVIGCGEAAMSGAAESGAFSVVTVLERQARDFRTLTARYGIADALLSVRAIGMPVLALELEREAAIAATIREARLAIEKDGARTIVFGCTGMLGFAGPVAEALGVVAAEVIDPLPFAVTCAHEAVLAGEMTDKDVFPTPESKKITGFDDWPALKAMMDGST